MATIYNKISIQNKIAKTFKESRYKNFAYNAANTRFIAAKQNLIEDFDENPVNKEILAGPVTADSNFLERGNLFSFIGFNNDAEPVQELRDFLVENIEIQNEPEFNIKGTTFIYQFPIQVPSLSEIDDFTSMEKYANSPNSYTTRSWVSIVRNGLGGFGSFLYHRFFSGKYSRSLTGLQNKKMKDKGGSFGGVKTYLSDILNEFKNAIRGT
jgi:hypothetical protein